MKFKNIYQKSEENIEKALLNLWTLGNHPMRGAVKEMFLKEPLMAEPVFQSTFGWEQTESDDWKNVFNPDVIKKIGIGVKYTPYKHQAHSWKTLLDPNNPKSIVVTSGTGSGKTECFMYPVINDIIEKNDPGAVQAIFLYPLNALMADQCDRLGELCDQTGIKFAVYNGNTKENVQKGTPRKSNEHGSQLRSRVEIRNTPPQILLSNPSMLEYMLVRGSDQTIMQRSRGKLRWIVIDEAHSYSGSSAIELKLQIRRILDAFGTDISRVRFACTSATIGGTDGTDSLKEFISALTGKDKNEIEIIGGDRLVPQLTNEELSELLLKNEIAQDASKILNVRREINIRSGMSLREIWMILHGSMKDFSILKGLDELDKLCELVDAAGNAVMSLRIHYHMRTISGLYACINPDCPQHSTTSKFRYLTSYTGNNCPHCNNTMLELVQCKDCGQFMISGEANNNTEMVRQHIDHKDSDLGLRITNENPKSGVTSPSGKDWTQFYLAPCDQDYEIPIEEGHALRYDFKRYGIGLHLKQNNDGQFVKLEDDDRVARCSNCGGSMHQFMRFNVPVDTLNKIVGRVLLEETAEKDHDWGKYIAFTDSRQGTAISAKTFNIESERITGVANIIRFLTSQRLNFRNDPIYQGNQRMLDTLLSIPDNSRTSEILNMIADCRKKLAGDINQFQISVFSDNIYNANMFNHVKSEDGHLDAYKAAVTRTVLGHRTLRKPSAESLGVFEITYSGMESVKMPEKLSKMKKVDGSSFTDEDWQDFLTIALDYEIRISNSIQPLIENERQYVREGSLSMPIAGADSSLDRSKTNKWMKVITSEKRGVLARQNRLVLLLCASMGIDSTDKLAKNEADINALLEFAWKDLTNRFLTKITNDGRGYTDNRYYGDEHVGSYYLDVSKDSTICNVKFLEEGWQCPVTHRILNRLFCGFSPAMTGKVNSRNFAKFKVKEPSFPLPIPETVNHDELLDWIKNDDKIQKLKEMGLWSDIHENYYLTSSSYIAAEHSAQQSDENLEKYTDLFKNNQLNVLNCSTTMEMGVDIGDIEVVLMDTVPPAAANYLQRAGRAGRAHQSKAVAFTLCNATPVGLKAFKNPMWALQDNNEMKMVLTSPVISQRHINSYLFHEYINENVEKFTAMTHLEDFFNGSKDGPSFCNDFIEKLKGYSKNKTLEASFVRVFGDIPFTVNKAIETIKGIKEEYWTAMDHLLQMMNEAEQQMNANPNDQSSIRRYNAIYAQVRRVRKEYLLSYLSEKQFIPNANMPTGIIEFDYCDQSTARKKWEIIKERAKLKDDIEKEKNGRNDPFRIIDLKKKRRSLGGELDKLIASTVISRDVRTALNEYAPGQTVVINERNFISDGIALWDNMDGQPRRRYLYHCEGCGHTKYTTYMLDPNGCKCEACRNEEYVSVIPRLAKRNHKYTVAYEPVKFRTTAKNPTTRVELTDKRYFDIRVELTDLSWNNKSSLHNVDFVSQQEGEIIYFNLGDGEGFAICSICGRSVIDTPNESRIPISDGHENLDGQICQGGEVTRHVAFTGRQQTCYTALRFYKNGTLCNDNKLVFSMGVVLKRAIVKYLGIDMNEIEFGIKNEKDSVVLFIYDVNKGGCGYSTHLGVPIECQEILDIAREMVLCFTCTCENEASNNGCCSQCLIDRTTYKYRDYLSKAEVMAWLLEQKGNAVSIPDDVKAYSPHARSRAESLGQILIKAVADNNVTEIGIMTSARAGIKCEDFVSINNNVGRALNDAVFSGKKVRVFVECDDDIDDFDTLYALSNISRTLVNYEIIPVKSLGTMPTVMTIKTNVGSHRLFTDKAAASLCLSEDWINCTDRLFDDNQTDNFQTTTLPTISSIKKKLTSQGKIVLEGDLPNKQYAFNKLFSEGICLGVIKDSQYVSFMEEILKGQKVSVDFSDAYVNSAFAAILLPNMIKEIADLFGCDIQNVTLYLDSYKRNIGYNYNDYNPITKNFLDKDTCDEFLKNIFEDVLGIDYTEHDNTKHHRWLKFVSPKGIVEIRPDHGLDGGWYTSTTYRQVENTLDFSRIRFSKAQYGSADVIYYIIMYKNK